MGSVIGERWRGGGWVQREETGGTWTMEGGCESLGVFRDIEREEQTVFTDG